MRSSIFASVNWADPTSAVGGDATSGVSIRVAEVSPGGGSLFPKAAGDGVHIPHVASDDL